MEPSDEAKLGREYRMSSKIVISYRRQDSEAITGRIRDRLAGQYGGESVFMDIDSIPFGLDFREQIEHALRHTDILIAIIGPRWARGGKGGRSRINEENDPVRVEVETALRRGIPVVPILVNGATMPKPTELPDGLKELSFRNAAAVDSGRDFHQHMDRVIRSMDQILVNRAKASGSPAATDPNIRVGNVDAAEAGQANPAEVRISGVAVKASEATATDDAAAQQASPKRSPFTKRWVLVAAAALVCAMLTAGAALYWKRPLPAVPSEQAATPELAPAVTVLDTSCKRDPVAAFFDDFKAPDRGWGEPEATHFFKDGQMVVKARENGSTPVFYWPLLFKNATICTEITAPLELKKADGIAAGGVIFWAADYQNYYVAEISADGTYFILRRIAGRWITVVPRTKADDIRPGPGAVNQLKIATGSNLASLFVNGAKVTSFWGQPPARGGSVGFTGDSEIDGQNEWKFSSIAVVRDNPEVSPQAPTGSTALLDSCVPHASVGFFDDFKVPDPAWGKGETKYFQDGQMVLKPKSNSAEAWIFLPLVFKVGTVCAEIKSPSQAKSPGTTSAGIVFWATDYQNYYVATLFRDGTFAIFRKIDGRWATVRPQASVSNVQLSTETSSRMKIAFNGDAATVVINDINVAQLHGQPATSGGSVGLYASDESEWKVLNIVVMIDDKPTAPVTQPVDSAAASAAANACKSASPVAFFDDFQVPDQAWGQPEPNRYFKDNQMVLKSADHVPQFWIYQPLVFDNATICSAVTAPPELKKVDGEAAGGILFWAADHQNFYVAEIFTEGAYEVWRRIADRWIQVVPRAKVDSIRQGPGVINLMKVTTAGNIATLFVNDTKIVDIWGQPPGKGGAVGLYGQSERGENEQWKFSYIAIMKDSPPQSRYPVRAASVSASCNENASLAFFDDFKPPDPGWPQWVTASSVKDGEMVLKVSPTKAVALIYFPLVFTKATVCSELKLPRMGDDAARAGSAGIIFWAVDYNNFYMCTLAPDGTYLVSRRIDAEWVTVIPPTKASVIRQGPDTVNRMKVVIEPNAATIIINDTVVTGFRGQPPAAGAAVGLFAQSGQEVETEWRFANIAILN
jgi:hypothetical protein